MNPDCQNDQYDSVWMGVCVALAERMDVHPLLVRANFVMAGLLLAPLVIAAYVLAAYLFGRRTAAC